MGRRVGGGSCHCRSMRLKLPSTALLGAALQGASGQTVPNLPPTKQCSENCPGEKSKPSPRSELAVYVFSTPGCRDNAPEIASTSYSKDACGWHYATFCPTAPCKCDYSTKGSGCVHGDSASLLLPPGAPSPSCGRGIDCLRLAAVAAAVLPLSGGAAALRLSGGAEGGGKQQCRQH